MNSKTTILLALLLGGLVLGYVGLLRQKPADSTTSIAPSAKSESGIARDLLSEPLGSVSKVVARRGTEEWVFEKKSPQAGGAAAWHMVKPHEMKVLSQEVDKIAREAGKIQYEISYPTGSGGVTEEAAGLKPPVAVIELTDEGGKSATIEIGKPVSESETYVRKAGAGEIVVAKANLRKLLKSKALEYRDLQLWNFPADQATRMEVCETQTDGKVACHYFVRKAGAWEFEKLVSAKTTAKVEEMVKAVARLRVAGWHDDDGSKLTGYGLNPGALQINVTVEETVPVAKDEAAKPKEDGAAEPAAEEPAPKRTVVYKLHLADQGPIGEETKVFVRSGDENLVATMFKSAADKFKPVMNEWRDMRVMAADPTTASRIELESAGQKTALVQKEGNWTFEADGAPAEHHAVTELLAGIKGLKAISFVEAADAGAVPNFDSPEADIRLTLPGSEAVEQIKVGGYTDPSSTLLVYVRHGGGAIAKVKAADVAVFLRPPVALRDRTVFNFDSEQLARVTISRPNDVAPGERQEFTLERSGAVWSMTAPIAAPVREMEVAKLVTELSALKGESIVGEAGEATAFGLHEPSMTISWTMTPPAEDKGAAGKDAVPSGQLFLAEHDGKIYARRGDGGPIYGLGRNLYDQLRAEYRTGDVLDFEPKDVSQLTLRTDAVAHLFSRKAGKWVYDREPDLPIDSAKIDKILADAKSLKTDRFAAYQSSPNAFGLDDPDYELLIRLQPGEKTQVLRVSSKTVAHQSAAPAAPEGKPGAAPATPASTTAHFATASDREGVFLIDSQAIQKVFLPLNELEKK